MRASLPGLEEKNIAVTVQDGMLSHSRRAERGQEEKGRQARFSGTYLEIRVARAGCLAPSRSGSSRGVPVDQVHAAVCPLEIEVL